MRHCVRLAVLPPLLSLLTSVASATLGGPIRSTLTVPRVMQFMLRYSF